MYKPQYYTSKVISHALHYKHVIIIIITIIGAVLHAPEYMLVYVPIYTLKRNVIKTTVRQAAV